MTRVRMNSVDQHKILIVISFAMILLDVSRCTQCL